VYSRKNSQATPVMARTIAAAIRQPRKIPSGRQARARTSRGEITAINKKM